MTPKHPTGALADPTILLKREREHPTNRWLGP
ncbi:hypothetical protein ACVJGD_008793 [Bradyrhizobium sp. USDA 10063]